VFCNPPYGDDIAPCMRRVAYFAAEGVEIIALLPHRTDTQWWQSTSGAAGKCEWEGRLKHPRGVSDKRQLRLVGVAHIEEAFPPPETGTAPFPSVVVYWGQRFNRFERAFADAGQIWQRVERRVRRRVAIDEVGGHKTSPAVIRFIRSTCSCAECRAWRETKRAR